MPRKYDKRQLAEQITALRACGLMRAEIAQRLGIGSSYLGKLITQWAIPRRSSRKRVKLCPHCGLDQNSRSALNGVGALRPEEA